MLISVFIVHKSYSEPHKVTSESYDALRDAAVLEFITAKMHRKGLLNHTFIQESTMHQTLEEIYKSFEQNEKLIMLTGTIFTHKNEQKFPNIFKMSRCYGSFVATNNSALATKIRLQQKYDAFYSKEVLLNSDRFLFRTLEPVRKQQISSKFNIEIVKASREALLWCHNNISNEHDYGIKPALIPSLDIGIFKDNVRNMAIKWQACYGYFENHPDRPIYYCIAILDKSDAVMFRLSNPSFVPFE